MDDILYFLIAAAHLQRAALILNAQQHTKIICTHYELPPGVLHVLYKSTSVIVFTEDINTCSHEVGHAASFYDLKERLLYSQYQSAVLKIKLCKLLFSASARY